MWQEHSPSGNIPAVRGEALFLLGALSARLRAVTLRSFQQQADSCGGGRSPSQRWSWKGHGLALPGTDGKDVPAAPCRAFLRKTPSRPTRGLRCLPELAQLAAPWLLACHSQNNQMGPVGPRPSPATLSSPGWEGVRSGKPLPPLKAPWENPHPKPVPSLQPPSFPSKLSPYLAS